MSRIVELVARPTTTIRPVGVDDQVLGEVVAAADVGLDDAVVAERRVEVAVGAVAGEQEVAVDARRRACSRRSRIWPSRRQRDAVGDVVGAEVGDRLAAVAERAVERAVGGVAHERDVLVGGAGDDDPAVGLDRDARGRRRRSCRGRWSRCRRRAEARVERAVGVVADEREVAVDARRAGREPGDDDLAVGLDGDRVGLVAAAEDVGRDDPVGAEAGVGRAVGPVADDAEVAVREARRVGAADGDDPAVGDAAPRRRPRRRRRRGRWWRCPPVPKLVSRLPAASWRVSAKSTPPPCARQPAVTMPPSGWITTASPCPAPTGVDTRPSLPNVGSSPDGSGGVAQWTATSVTSAPARSRGRAHGADLVGVVRLGRDLDVVGRGRRRACRGT